MENLRNDGLLTEKGPVNCEFKQSAANQLSGYESVAKNQPIFFPFPFPPYDIQEDFMNSLFHVLENGEVGIFESPTGTVGVDEWKMFRGRRTRGEASRHPP